MRRMLIVVSVLGLIVAGCGGGGPDVVDAAGEVPASTANAATTATQATTSTQASTTSAASATTSAPMTDHDAEDMHDEDGVHATEDDDADGMHDGIDDMHDEDGVHATQDDDADGMHDESEHDAATDLSEEHIPTATGAVTAEHTVSMAEFAFDPDVLVITPGETVRFVLVNDGQLPHEFRLTTAHKAQEHIEAGHDHGGGGHHEEAAPDIVVNVAAGETRTVEMTIPLDAEIDQVACLIPGHHEAGMWGLVEA